MDAGFIEAGFMESVV